MAVGTEVALPGSRQIVAFRKSFASAQSSCWAESKPKRGAGQDAGV